MKKLIRSPESKQPTYYKPSKILQKSSRKQKLKTISDSSDHEYSQMEYMRIRTNKPKQSMSFMSQKSHQKANTFKSPQPSSQFKSSLKSPSKNNSSYKNLSMAREPEIDMEKLMIRQEIRGKLALKNEKEKEKLRELIEIGQKQHRLLMDLYSIKVRELNEQIQKSKSKSKSKSKPKSQQKSISPKQSLKPRKTLNKSIVKSNFKQKRKISSPNSIPTEIDHSSDLFNNQTLRKICKSLHALKAKLSQNDQRPTNLISNVEKFKSIQSRSIKQMKQSILTSNRKQKRSSSMSIGTNTDQIIDDPQVLYKFTRNIQRVFSKLKLISFLTLKHTRCLNEFKTQIPSQKTLSIGINTQTFVQHVPPPSAKQKQKMLKKIENQRYKLLIESRESQQLQISFLYQKSEGISTNLHVINEYLICIINYLTMYYDEQLLREFQKPYGLSYFQRMRVFNGYDNDSDYQHLFIVSEEIFTQFQSNVIDSSDQESTEETRKYQRFHSKCIFDSFNQTLNTQRKCYKTNGEPFPWDHTPTQFQFPRSISITQLKHILDKVRQTIINKSRTLAGILLEEEFSKKDEDSTIVVKSKELTFSEFIESPLHSHPLILKHKDSRINDLVNEEIRQQGWEDANGITELGFMICEEIFDEMCGELVKFIKFMRLKYG